MLVYDSEPRGSPQHTISGWSTGERSISYSPPPAFGPFRVLHQIGAGVLGPVFRTHDPDSDHLVAVKAFTLDLPADRARELADLLQRLVERGLAHAQIAAPLGAGVEDGHAYLASEYVAAGGADTALRQYGPAPVPEAMRLIRRLASAIDFAASVGAHHGALHLRDILVAPEEARITGFGVAAAVESLGVRAPIRRPYAAPERIEGGAIDRATDIYALAAISFELLLGRRLAGPGEDGLRGLDDLRGADASGLRETFASALDPNPDLRFRSAQSFADALQGHLGRHDSARIVEFGDRGAAVADPSPEPLLAEPNQGPPVREQVAPRPDAVELPIDKDVETAFQDWTFPDEEERMAANVPPTVPLGELFEIVEPNDADVPANVEREADDTFADADVESSLADPGVKVAPVSFDLPLMTESSEAASLPLDPPFDSEAPHSPLPAPQPAVPRALQTPPSPPMFTAAASPARGRSRMWWTIAATLGAGLVIGVLLGFQVDKRFFAPSTKVGKPFTERTIVETPAARAPAPVPPAPVSAAPAAPGRAAATPPPAASTAKPVDGPPEPVASTANSAAVKTAPLKPEAKGPASAAPVRREKPPAVPKSRPAPATTDRGSVIVDSRPRGAQVTLDGQPVGTTPLSIGQLGAGPHTVRLELPGYRPWTASVGVVGGKQTRVAASLEVEDRK